jgi:hypothetical protein
VYAHYALHRLKILPSTLLNMSREEKAFIYASIDIHADKEKRALIKTKKKN